MKRLLHEIETVAPHLHTSWLARADAARGGHASRTTADGRLGDDRAIAIAASPNGIHRTKELVSQKRKAARGRVDIRTARFASAIGGALDRSTLRPARSSATLGPGADPGRRTPRGRSSPNSRAPAPARPANAVRARAGAKKTTSGTFERGARCVRAAPYPP